jgi:sulfate transport system permease protein
MLARQRTKHLLPGFKLSLGYTLFYLSLVVLIPLSMLFLHAGSLTWSEFSETLGSARVLAAFKVNVLTSVVAALINGFFGLIVAWVQVRYTYVGKTIIDALIDIPFALPTSVAGIALTATFGLTSGVGKILGAWGIKIAYTPLGIILALTFIGIPFVVRTVEPVLKELEPELEEAAATLGASRVQTFCKVLFPGIFPTLITGTALAFARGLGEYGSVVFISGNLPFKTEVVSLVIMSKLEQYDYTGATAVATAMLVLSFIILLGINGFQYWSRNRIAMDS